VNKSERRNIKVYAHWEGLNHPTFMGELHGVIVRGKEIFSFEYNRDWLRNSQAKQLDPSLQLLHGQQYAPVEQENFVDNGFLVKLGLT